MPLLGTLVNAITVICGSVLGMLLSRLFEKRPRLASIPDSAMKAISVFVVFIGVKDALSACTDMKTSRVIAILISIVVGTVIGTVINIDGALERFGSFMERRFVKGKPALSGFDEIDEQKKNKSISKGFISTTLTCCVGALSIMGALNSGLTGGEDQALLYTKSVLDFITALVFSSAFGGIGAMLSAVPIIIYQGGIELASGAIAGILTGCLDEISATGSIIVIALGLNMVGATKIKIANMLPSIFLPILLCLFM
ncbi:MAG: DUF554 domain-containing protein [Clostridia bacterium]|nr:DUF554 domain-containing protein [Clostridia bacterium]